LYWVWQIEHRPGNDLLDDPPIPTVRGQGSS
jgi:hypothetical protein